MSLKAGICGIGSFYSSAFARAATGNSDVELKACAHLNQDETELKNLGMKSHAEFGDQFGIKSYGQVAEMVEAESLDLVFVACPDSVKATEAVNAMNAGTHVYVAKPMCMSLDGADEMISTSEENGVLLSALMPGRDDGAIRAMGDRVQAGGIGKVITSRAWIQHGCFGPSTVFEGSGEFGPDQGGIPLSLGFYSADLLLWLIDSPPVRAYAEYDNLATPHSIWMDTGKGIVRFEDGRMGSMDIIFNVSCGAPSWEMEVVGTDGIARAHLDMMEGILWHKEDRGSPHVFYRHQPDTIATGVGRFVKSILNGSDLDVTPQHARNVLELCLAWTQSSEENQPVSLPLGS